MAGQGRKGIGYLEEKKYKYAHEKRINALNLEPGAPNKIDLTRRCRKMKDPPPRGAATTRNFRAALEEIDRKMKGMVISRSVEALGRAIDEEQKTEQRMLRPGTGSAAPSTEHRTEGQYVGVRTYEVMDFSRRSAKASHGEEDRTTDGASWHRLGSTLD